MSNLALFGICALAMSIQTCLIFTAYIMGIGAGAQAAEKHIRKEGLD